VKNDNDSSHDPLHDTVDHIVKGYDTMMEKLYEWSEKTEEKTGPLLIQGIQQAEQFMQELGEWTEEEVSLLSSYVKRDIHHMSQSLEQQNKQLSSWLQIDVDKVENSLLSILSHMTDQTRQELDHLRHLAEEAQHLHTGQVTSVGKITCTACGSSMDFHKAGRIPPCPKCHKTAFSRID